MFTAVANELGRLIGVEATFVSRLDHQFEAGNRQGRDPEGYVTVVGSYGRVSDRVSVGFRTKLLPETIQAVALRTGRPARVNGERLTKGPYGGWLASMGLRAGVAVPIMVGGRRWGVTAAVTSRKDFPPAPSRAWRSSPSSLRWRSPMPRPSRSCASSPTPRRPCGAWPRWSPGANRRRWCSRRRPVRAPAFGGGTARMVRYQPDGTATLLANEGTTGPHVRVGDRWEGYPPTGLTVTVRRTGRAARVDDYRDVPGAEVRIHEGILSSVAVPIYVNGGLWGMIAVGSGQAPPPDTEQRMSEFTDLIATAVANAQNRSALETSRDELARLLEEQAALRRVATLVARGIDPAKIFSAVAEEIRRLLDADNAGMAASSPMKPRSGRRQRRG